MLIASLTEWNDFLKTLPNAHVLQTGEWGELKSAFGWKPVRLIEGNTGCQILFRKFPFGATIAYIPKPALNHPELVMDEVFWRRIDAVCREHRAIFCKLEPDGWAAYSLPASAARTGLKISSHNIQPPRTIIIDLQMDEPQILARMRQKTRYNIRLAKKKGVSVRPWNDLHGFHKMVQATSERDRFGAHSPDYFRKAYELFHPSGICELLLAEYDQTPLAALMVFRRGARAWYLYGASTDQSRERMPSYLLQWEAMRWARSHGCETYDLWGVPDHDEPVLEDGFEQRSDGLWGVYRFKRGFGGQLKRASQAIDRIYNPVLYRLYLMWMAGREAG